MISTNRALINRDDDARVLIAVLNGEQDSLDKSAAALKTKRFTRSELEQSTTRVASLVSTVGNLVLRMKNVADQAPKTKQDGATISLTDNDREIEKLQREVNHLLLPYTSALTLRVLEHTKRETVRSSGSSLLSFSYQMIGTDRPVKVPGAEKDIYIPWSEAVAVNKFQRLMAEGKATNLRRCLAPTVQASNARINPDIRCLRWFLAPRIDRYWCSKACYFRLYAAEPDYREQLLELAGCEEA